MFLRSLPRGCSVHPSWHSHVGSSAHHELLLLISTPKKTTPTRSKLSSALLLPVGVSSSPGIFSKLCSSGAFGLREITPEWHAGGDREEGGLVCSPKSWGC